MQIDEQPIIDEQAISHGNIGSDSPSDALSPVGEAIASAASHIPGLQAIASNPTVQAGVSGANALGSGIQQGLANTVGMATGSSSLQDSLSPPDITNMAQAQHPITNAIGQGIGYMAPAAALTATAGGAAASVLGRGLISDTVANAAAGSILAGPDNRVRGGVVGAAITPVANAIGSVGSYLSNSSTIIPKIKNFAAEMTSKIPGTPSEVAAKSQANMWQITQATENKMFNEFRATAGNVNSQAITSQAASFLQGNKRELTATQQKSVMNLITNSVKAESLADLHDARKIFAYDYSKFTQGKPLTGDASKEFQTLVSTITNTMETNASDLGVLDKFKAANSFFKTQTLPLINTGAKDTAEALANATDPLTAAKVNDVLINKYLNPANAQQAKVFLGTLDDNGRKAFEVGAVQKAVQQATNSHGEIDPLTFSTNIKQMQSSIQGLFSPESNTMVNGLAKAADKATHIFGTELNLAKLSPGYKLSLGLGTAGLIGVGAYKSEEGAQTGINAYEVVAGTISGLALLTHSQVGRAILMRVGTEGGEKVSKDLLNGLMLQTTLHLAPKDGQEQQQQIQQSP